MDRLSVAAILRRACLALLACGVSVLWAGLEIAQAAETVTVPLPEPRPKTEVMGPPAPQVEAFVPPPLPEPRPTLTDPAEPAESAAAPPPPTESSPLEANACMAELARVGASFSPAPVQAIADECRPIDTVSLEAVGGEDQVRIKPAVVVTCPVALALSGWINESVRPAAKESHGVGIEVLAGAGYDCRTRNRANGAPMSEHAKANAVDIMGFALGPARTPVDVLKDWGQEKPAGLFLARIHADACRHFTTVLGPNADAAHANHFHLDLKTRGKSLSRLCQ